MTMAQQIYAKQFKNADGTSNMGIGGISHGYTADNQLLDFAERLANRLKGSSIAFVVAEDTSGLEDT